MSLSVKSRSERRPTIASATPSEPNAIQHWLRKFKTSSDRTVSNTIPTMTISQLIALRSKLESECDILNEKLFQCYTQDKSSMDLIQFGLEKMKSDTNLKKHHKIFLERYEQAQANNSIIFSEFSDRNTRINSQFCMSLLYTINRYDSQKCFTTNVIKHLIADTKNVIRRVTDKINHNTILTHYEKTEKQNDTRTWRDSGEDLNGLCGRTYIETIRKNIKKAADDCEETEW